MNKALGLALLVGGGVLIYFGYNASQSIESKVTQTFNGSPSHKTMWLYAGGAAAAAAGLYLVAVKK